MKKRRKLFCLIALSIMLFNISFDILSIYSCAYTAYATQTSSDSSSNNTSTSSSSGSGNSPEIYMVGDERFLGMKTAVTSPSNMYWYVAAKADRDYYIAHWKDDLFARADKSKDVCVVGLGIREKIKSSEVQENYVKMLQNMTGHFKTVYFCEVGPVDESKCSKKNKNIQGFNSNITKNLKSETKIKVVTDYGFLENLKPETDTSGISYTAKVYKKWFKRIKKQANITGGNGAEQSATDLEKLKNDILALYPDENSWSEERKSAQAESVALILAVLKTDGFTDQAMAGVCANMIHESRFDPYIWESNSDYFEAYVSGEKDITPSSNSSYGGVGLIQWTFGRHTKFSDYCQDNDKDSRRIHASYQTSKGVSTDELTYAGTPGTQAAYLLLEDTWNHNEGDVGLPQINGYGDFKALTDEVQASKYYTVCAEVPGDRVSKANERAKDAPNWLDLIRGTAIGNVNGEIADTTEATKAASQLAASGYWTEEDLVQFNRLMENKLDLEGAILSNLKQKETSSLSDWQQNINYMNEESTVLSLLRRLSILIGIIAIIWAVVFYAAYWFDRVNTIMPINALGLISFGKFAISFEDNMSLVNESRQGGVKYLNHSDVVKRALLAMFFGVLMISGELFVLLNKVVSIVMEKLY